jgi:hypothetical protein
VLHAHFSPFQGLSAVGFVVVVKIRGKFLKPDFLNSQPRKSALDNLALSEFKESFGLPGVGGMTALPERPASAVKFDLEGW